MKIIRRSHLVQSASNCRVYNGNAKDTQPRAYPERNKPDAYVGAYDVEDPVWGQGCDAEDDEE